MYRKVIAVSLLLMKFTKGTSIFSLSRSILKYVLRIMTFAVSSKKVSSTSLLLNRNKSII